MQDYPYTDEQIIEAKILKQMEESEKKHSKRLEDNDCIRLVEKEDGEFITIEVKIDNSYSDDGTVTPLYLSENDALSVVNLFFGCDLKADDIIGLANKKIGV